MVHRTRTLPSSASSSGHPASPWCSLSFLTPALQIHLPFTSSCPFSSLSPIQELLPLQDQPASPSRPVLNYRSVVWGLGGADSAFASLCPRDPAASGPWTDYTLKSKVQWSFKNHLSPVGRHQSPVTAKNHANCQEHIFSKM